MALIRSLAVGKSRKSAGDLTFQSYYGKVVAKQKIVANKSYVPTAKQIAQRNKQVIAGKLVHLLIGTIPVSFVRSQYGTKVNNFVKSNYELLYGPSSNTVPFTSLQSIILASQSNGDSVIPFTIAKGLSLAFTTDVTSPAGVMTASNNNPLVATDVVMHILYQKKAGGTLYNHKEYFTENTVGSGKFEISEFALNTMANISTGDWCFMYYITVDDKPVTGINQYGEFTKAS